MSNTDQGILSEIYEDILILIVEFIVHKEPSSLTILKRINKYWFRSLDPNKPNVNLLWEKNICRMMFASIPRNLRMKRWDRYYQYRLNYPNRLKLFEAELSLTFVNSAYYSGIKVEVMLFS